jgi:hypothetical protein
MGHPADQQVSELASAARTFASWRGLRFPTHSTKNVEWMGTRRCTGRCGRKATADPSTHHPQTLPQRAKIALWGPRKTFGAPFAQDDRGQCGFVVSHPVDRRKSTGWGTEGLVVSRPSDKNKNVAPRGRPGGAPGTRQVGMIPGPQRRGTGGTRLLFPRSLVLLFPCSRISIRDHHFAGQDRARARERAARGQSAHKSKRSSEDQQLDQASRARFRQRLPKDQ